MKYNFQKLKEICRTKDSIQMLQALVEAEAELRELLKINTVDQPYKGCPAVETFIKEILRE